MSMFFPESRVTGQVTKFLNTTQCEEFRGSLLFDPKERSNSKSLPDRRTRTSYKFRDKKFWTEWTEFLKTERYYADVYPLDWSLAVRPIVAHCQSTPPFASSNASTIEQKVADKFISSVPGGSHRAGVHPE